MSGHPSPAPTRMSKKEADEWFEAAEEMTAPHVLTRIGAHQQFILSNITLVGTLLAGLGGLAATLSVGRTTWFWGGVPVLPLCTLAVSTLAGAAVVVALVSRRPRFDTFNKRDADDIRRHFVEEIEARKRGLQVASGLFIAAAVAAALTAAVAGLAAILDPAYDPADGPRDLSTLTSTVGESGAVSVAVGGSVDHLSDGQYVRVSVVTDGQTVVSSTVHPDADGTAALSGTARAPVGTTGAAGTVSVLDAQGDEVDSFAMEVAYPAAG